MRSLAFRSLAVVALSVGMGGCTTVTETVKDMWARTENTLFMDQRPGLDEAQRERQRIADAERAAREQAEAERLRAMMPPPPPPPAMPSPERESVLPLPVEAAPVTAMTPAQARQALAADPLARRFLLLRRLQDEGLVPEAEVAPRRTANLGALLPLTTIPPAVGLEARLPPDEEVVGRFRELGRKGGLPSVQASERGFLLDRILPLEPVARAPLSPHDVAMAREVQKRLDRLEAAGLISPEEKAVENGALERLIASGTLAPVLAEAKPEPPAKPKPARRLPPGGPAGLRSHLDVPILPPPMDPKQDGGVHLLSMASPTMADKAWDALKKEHPELAQLSHKALKANLGELGTTWRLVAGPLGPREAEMLCATLRTRGQACMSTVFPKEEAAAPPPQAELPPPVAHPGPAPLPAPPPLPAAANPAGAAALITPPPAAAKK